MKITVDLENLSTDTREHLARELTEPSALYDATLKEQTSSDMLKFILKNATSGLILSRALKHKNTRFEEIEEYVLSHKFNFDYDFDDAKFYLNHSQTSPESIYLFAQTLIKQYMDSNKKYQTSIEYLLLEIIKNSKTDSKTLFWLVTETRKKGLLCDTTMLKRLKKALKKNPNTTESILWEVSED